MRIILIFLAAFVVVIAFRLWLLGRQRGQYKAYWDTQAAVTPAEDAIWYVALGDSAAQGIGASHPTKGYVGQIAEDLKQKTAKPVHVVNLSVSGAKITDIINKQLPQFPKNQLPLGSIVTVEVGANDMTSFEPGRFEREFDQMLQLLPQDAYVSDVPYFGKGIFRSRQRNVEVANRIVDKLVVKYQLRKVSLHHITKMRSSWRNNAIDLFHPNDLGYRWWHEAFSQAINQN